MDLTFMGSASAYPSPTRGVSGTVFRNDGVYYLFDCGEGTQIQLQKSTIRPGKITCIFIGHLHGDHSFGLPGLICTICMSNATRSSIDIYGPLGVAAFVKTAMLLTHGDLDIALRFHELVSTDASSHPQDCELCPKAAQLVKSAENVKLSTEEPGFLIYPDKDGVWHLFSDETHTVKAGRLQHRLHSFGFVIEEARRAGSLDVAKLRAVGVEPGPICARLKAGETVTLDDGRKLDPGDFVSLPRRGRRVALLGDSCDSSAMVTLATDVDVLVHEATMENAMEETAILKGHSTPQMAARFAETIRAGQLIINHFSHRYKRSPDGPDDPGPFQDKLLQEARQVFPNTLAADDLLTFPVHYKDSS